MASLSVKQRKERLVQQFELMIQDEQKMSHLEQMFHSILGYKDSALNDDQKSEVLKTKQKVLSGEMKTTPLKEVQAKLDRKYGL